MDMWIVWLIVAALLVVVEIRTQMIWTICLAIGCLGAIVAYFAGLDIAWQVVTMAMVSVAAFVILLPVFKRWHENHPSNGDKALTGMEALPGRRATVTEPIEPGQIGRARIDGDTWQVRSPRLKTTIDIGNEVVVTSFEGNILDVEPLT